jgi:NADPH2:quinone reductase
MKAIGFTQSLSITEKESFSEFEIPTPHPAGQDLLMRIIAIGVNPVDYKVRQNSAKETILSTPKVIGWDAVGTVEDIGPDVTLFKKGDEVYYSGDLNRSGCNAEYQLIDERIVGGRPLSLSYAESAAMPLTTITAWEMLFERFRITEKDRGKSILIIGGAGGVGSIATQLAKKVAGLVVICTASREETRKWCQQQGADYIVDHSNLVDEVREAGFQYVDFILDCVDVNQYWSAFVELIKPQGRIGSISDPKEPVKLSQLKSKSVAFHWELMYTRSLFQTEDMIEQHHILNIVAKLFDDGTLKSTLNNTLQGFNADNLKEAHRLLESGKAIGKTVITY